MPCGTRATRTRTRSRTQPYPATIAASTAPATSAPSVPLPSVSSVSDLSMSQFVALVGQVVRANVPPDPTFALHNVSQAPLLSAISGSPAIQSAGSAAPSTVPAVTVTSPSILGPSPR